MNPQKLILLNKRHWREHAAHYRIAVTAIFVVLLFMFFLVWHWRDSFGGDAHRGIFLIGLFGGGSIFAASLLKEIADAGKGIWLLALPASAWEKVFVAIIYATIVYTAVFIATFLVAETIFNRLADPGGGVLQPTNLLQNGFYHFVFNFITCQLLILLGSLTFKKAALIKTMLFMIGCFAFFGKVNNLLLAELTGQASIDGGGLFSYFQFRHAGENVYVHLPKVTELVVSLGFDYGIPLLLCYIIFLKFRETEI